MKHVLTCAALATLLPPHHVAAETLKVVVESAVAGVDPLTTQPIVT